MAHKDSYSPSEGFLYELLNEVRDIKEHCMGGRNAPLQLVTKISRTYVADTTTRAKILVLCSEHVQPALGICHTFQDSKHQDGQLKFFDVTPTNTDIVSTNRIYNIPLIIEGKVIRLLIATNQPIEGADVSTEPQILTTEAAKKSEDAPGKSSHGGALNIEQLYVQQSAKQAQLGETDQAMLLKSGLGQLESAIQAIKNAHATLSAVLPGPLSAKTYQAVRNRAFTLQNSLMAVAELVKDDPQKSTTPSREKSTKKRALSDKDVHGTDKIMQELIGAYTDEKAEDVFTAAELRSIRAWIESRQPKPSDR